MVSVGASVFTLAKQQGKEPPYIVRQLVNEIGEQHQRRITAQIKREWRSIVRRHVQCGGPQALANGPCAEQRH